MIASRAASKIKRAIFSGTPGRKEPVGRYRKILRRSQKPSTPVVLQRLCETVENDTKSPGNLETNGAKKRKGADTNSSKKTKRNKRETKKKARIL